MTTKTDPSALMPITYFPHYAVFMGGSSGGLFLSYLRELHRKKFTQYGPGWDGWFLFDYDAAGRRLYGCVPVAVRTYEAHLKRGSILEVQNKPQNFSKYYKLNIEKLDAGLQDALERCEALNKCLGAEL